MLGGFNIGQYGIGEYSESIYLNSFPACAAEIQRAYQLQG